METILLILAVTSLLIGFVYGGAMIGHIAGKGVRIKWFLIKLYYPWYISLYHRMTLEETGRPGPLFRPFVICMATAVLLALVAVTLAR